MTNVGLVSSAINTVYLGLPSTGRHLTHSALYPGLFKPWVKNYEVIMRELNVN